MIMFAFEVVMRGPAFQVGFGGSAQSEQHRHGDLAVLDLHISKLKEPTGRPEAIRRLVELGLKGKR